MVKKISRNEKKSKAFKEINSFKGEKFVFLKI